MPVFIAVILLLLSFIPCALQEETRAFTDSTGTTFTLPESITRVAVTGPLAQYAVFAIAPEMLVGFAASWGENARGIIPDTAFDLPVLGQLYKGKGNINPETLLTYAPQVVIDIGEGGQSVKSDLADLTFRTGIPFIHIDASLDSFDRMFAMLGQLLGKEAEALALSQYCVHAYENGCAVAQEVNSKARALYVLGVDGLHVLAKNSYHSGVIDLLTDNLAVLESPTSAGTGNETDMEQIYVWNPDVILFSPESVYDTCGTDALWQGISAIEKHQYYRVPSVPQNWMGFPPACQRLLGMEWLAYTLYPDQCHFDLYEEAKTYFQLFYHCELTEDMFQRIIGQ